MIVESLLDVFLFSLSTALSGFEVIGVPYELINALSSVIMYGIWVVGPSVITLFSGTVVFWWGLKFIVGIIVFVWELLPLT